MNSTLVGVVAGVILLAAALTLAIDMSFMTQSMIGSTSGWAIRP